MEKNKLITKWWIWLIGLVGLGLTYVFILGMSYSLTPTEIQIYANDEMVATSDNVLELSKDKSFNECQEQCIDVVNYGITDGWLLEYDFYDVCINGCNNHYNITELED